MFRMFDLNGDGVVTREELRSVIGDLWQGTAGDGEESELRHSADELIELLDVDEDGTVSREEFAKFRTSVAVLGSLPDADAATAAAIECKFTPRVEAEILEDEDDVNVDEDDDDISAADISKINFEDDTVAGQASWTTASGAYAPAVDVSIVSMEKARSTAAKVDEEADEDSSFSEDEVEDAVAAFAAAQAMSPPPLPPAPPAGRIRPADETLREASRQLKDKQGGEVQWQLVWDLMRAGRPETARELFYQRTTKNPSSTTLWEQWARFELLQGDAERARGLYRAALLHAEGRPRARAESLRKWGVMEFGAGEPANAVGLFERALNVLQDAEEAAAAAEEAETVEHLGTGSASNSRTPPPTGATGSARRAPTRAPTSSASRAWKPPSRPRRSERHKPSCCARGRRWRHDPETSPPPTRSSRMRAPATVTTSGSCTRRLSWRRLEATSRSEEDLRRRG